ncbi:MAG: bifunctional 4-hydroxy-2-oxoglutarate aldolase/2-dehydro-3-deoxy-phosphogluconate aldolase [Flammeovirgaceae bacterium]|nr:bifunctional 4-hydroxy-2-oxoglutarate aldolase/2-dehydro-3-deoxy-phosphogluconate aldolase [Flammeovirgaceae bacterium]
MKFTKQQIVAGMEATGLVPLFSHDDATKSQAVLEASYRGGVRVFEITNRKANSFEVFKHLREAANDLPGMMLGIGTIMDAKTTLKFIEAGADFIISPILKIEMAQICHDHNVHWIPGCATLTEIVTAKEHGAEVIKVFPGSVLGPQFVSSIMPVVPDLKLMITGGVEPTHENLKGWFKAGAMCVGMGSHLTTKDIIANNDWTGLQKKVESILTLISEIRK